MKKIYQLLAILFTTAMLSLGVVYSPANAAPTLQAGPVAESAITVLPELAYAPAGDVVKAAPTISIQPMARHCGVKRIPPRASGLACMGNVFGIGTNPDCYWKTVPDCR